MENKFKIIVLASGTGGNFLHLAKMQSQYDYQISKLIVDRPCLAIEKAQDFAIDCIRLDRKDPNFNINLFSQLDNDCNLIVLAGFLSIISPAIVKKFENKIINIHPSLLPKYGGMGMHGMNVHKAVFANGEKQSGCTVHFVDNEVDTGKIICQKTVDISQCNSPLEIQKQVYTKEPECLLEAIVKLKSNLI